MPTLHPESRTELLQRIMLAWRALLRSKPDLAPRTGERGELDRALASALLRSALAAPGDPTPREELASAASEYARLPRRRRFDARATFRELAMLRSVVWLTLRECFPPGAERVRFLKLLDRATMSALRAAVRAKPESAEADAVAANRRHDQERRRTTEMRL